MGEALQKLKGWRTALLVIIAIVALELALVLLVYKQVATGVDYLKALGYIIVALIAIAAGRNLGQDAVGGGGLAGLKTILTSAKPEAPPAGQVQP